MSRFLGSFVYLDSCGEFVERRSEAKMSVPFFDTKFVVSSAKVLYERLATSKDSCGSVGFESAHCS